MLSNKMTFSLTCLVVLLAFGIVCAVPSAFADGDNNKDHFDIDVTISAGETMVDVSAEDGFQIATGRDRASRDFTEGPASLITLTFTFSKGVINLHSPATGTTGENPLTSSGDAFGLDDVFVEAFDVDGRSLGAFSVEDVTTADVAADTAALTSFADANNPGRVFLLRIDEAQIANAYHAARGGSFEIHRLSFLVPQAIPKKDKGRRIVDSVGVKNLALDHFGPSFDPDSHAHYNKKSNVFTIDLVDDDEGEAMYLPIATNATVGNAPAEGTPGVVAITRILDRHAFQPIESGPFNVRIILTEEPKGGLTTDLIEVINGKATAIRKGQSLKGARTAAPAQTSELTPNIVNYYVMATANTLAAQDGLPEATGRDNMYHQYVATITPNPGFDGDVTIAIKQFMDNVLPVANMYVPLTASQRTATILSGPAEIARDARLMNETLMVPVHTIADEKVTAAKAGYDALQAIYDANPLLKPLGNKLIIPAGGYLVLAKGKTDSDPVSGVVNVSAKTKDKKTAAQMLYNVVYDFGLPFPADDLSNFFRNGGTLNLIYQDIPAATGSGHGDSKGPTGDDATGYTAATTNAYAAGALIINEVMWGLDANSPNSQYIELHNPGTTAVGIDNKEWAIAVGAAPAGFTVIDSVGNNPASGYWQVPGSDGVSKIQTSAGFFTLVDIVSMSRMTGATDGTAAASWAASIRPSANIGGRRIGTPGAANTYDTSAQAAADAAAKAAADAAAKAAADAAAASKASPATAADLMISEIMVASNSGRLPQWIEIKNTSMGKVSLDGWVVGIDNDSDDSDVVSTSLSIKLDGVTLDANKVALVVSKTSNRNSGVTARTPGDSDENAGMLDSNRIIDASSQIKPASMTYSMLSEMSFRISLEPPLPLAGGVTVRGDVVGNLGGGWTLPTSEAGRSSIIRRETGEKGEIMGTDEAGWVSASDTALIDAYVATYYGDKDDMGTPGYDSGGALPVELSKFGAKRDPLTGQVIVTWETQSELNNAGFFIKRSQQKNAKFVAVNPTMIIGAGTTSEKQTYTYTDTTAKPNIVYYYQIEDVSLDGQRQTLTRAHRLKGHVGAAGKLTTLWGQLKEQQ